jgi:flagellar basal-body rod modification protein FlgD
LDKNDFLKLLVAQIKVQDPLNPMDGAAFTAQLAQFSSLEQLYNVNANLGALQSVQETFNGVQALGYIGKTVAADGDGVTLGPTGEARLAFELESDAAKVAARIIGANGRLVRTIEAGPMSQGFQTIGWDGRDANGSRLAQGPYRFEIVAMDNADRMVPAVTLSSGEVTGIVKNSGGTFLLVGQEPVAVSQVVRVLAPKPEAAE